MKHPLIDKPEPRVTVHEARSGPEKKSDGDGLVVWIKLGFSGSDLRREREREWRGREKNTALYKSMQDRKIDGLSGVENGHHQEQPSMWKCGRDVDFPSSSF